MANENKINSEQLDCFFFLKPADRKYSNTVELFDSIPFYSLQQPKNKEFVEKEFEHTKTRTTYTVNMVPGHSIQRSRKKDRYLSVTDELVEQVIRKIATEGQAFLYDGKVAVAFTLYQIHEELSGLGLTRSYTEIRESIDILCTSFFNLKWADEKGNTKESTGHIFNDLKKVGPKELGDIEHKAKKDMYCVVFHELVAKSIVEGTFRQFNYQLHMSIKDYVARWIHKRMSHHYTQANAKNSKQYYHLSLKTIIQGAGLKENAQIYDNIKRIKKALETLIDRNVLYDYDIKEKRETPRSKRTTDAVFCLYPSSAFANDQIAANARSKRQRRANIKAGIRQLSESLTGQIY